MASTAIVANWNYVTTAGQPSRQPWQSRKKLLSLPIPSCRTSLPGGNNKNRPRLTAQVIVAAQSSSTSSSSGAQSQTSVGAAGGEQERIRQCLEDLADGTLGIGTSITGECLNSMWMQDTLILPSDFLSKLPDGLKIDLNDAAFALSSGPLNQECGETVGQLVMGLSRALEQADTQTTAALASEVSSIQDNLPSDPFSNAALGKRLQAAGRYLASTGQYGNGELQKLSKALLAAGEALLLNNPNAADNAPPKETTRMFKFGDLQLQLTAQRAYIGAAVAFVFGVFCWNFASGLANGDVSPEQYANSNSFTVATSLRGTLLTAGYTCTALSAISMVGLLALATQLGSKEAS